MCDNKIMLPIYNKLNDLLDKNEAALPKDFNRARFTQNCTAVLETIKDIQNIESQSIARTLLKGAFMGLDFFNGECYAIPYKDWDDKGIKKMKFQTDYKGEKKLAKKYSINSIKDMYAKIVREEDEFEENVVNGYPSINFKPKAFSNKPIIGAFAVAIFSDETIMYETMSKEDIEAVKETYSKKDKNGNHSKAWVKTPGEMYKKTVLRRLCKNIELDFDSLKQRQLWNESSEMYMNKKIEAPKHIPDKVDFIDVKSEAVKAGTKIHSEVQKELEEIPC